MRYSYLLWFLLWPFHHKPALPPAAPDQIIRSLDGHITHMPDRYCDREGDQYFFLGPDSLIGIGDTCDAAFQGWRWTTAPKSNMHRVSSSFNRKDGWL